MAPSLSATRESDYSSYTESNLFDKTDTRKEKTNSL